MRSTRGWASIVGATVACWLILATGAGAATPGRFTVVWGPAAHAKQDRAAVAVVRRSGLLERLAQSLNAQVALPFDEALRVDDSTGADIHYVGAPVRAGVAGSFWLAHVRHALNQHNPLRGFFPRARRLSVDRTLAYGVQFFMAHEMGHAAIEQLDLPVLGREEDAADGFGTYVLLSDPKLGPTGVFAASALLTSIARLTPKLDDRQLADPHSLPRQRVVQMLCWVYGSNPAGYGYLLKASLLPPWRAASCPTEWAHLQHTWSRLLPRP